MASNREGHAPGRENPGGWMWPRKLCRGYNWEGFGLPALEALACGTPVIASNRGALPEVVGDAAFLVDPFNYESIASAMLEISTNSSFLKKAQLEGPRQASGFNWECTAKQIENILLQI